MSSTNEADWAKVVVAIRPWSLATRLTLWFFVSSFTLVLASTGYLYFVLANNLDEEDDHFLTDRARALLAIVGNGVIDKEALRQQVEWAGAARQDAPIYLRIVGADKRIIAQTPGMDDVLAPADFPEAVADQGATLPSQERRSATGGSFRVLAVRKPPFPGSVQAAMDRSQEEELLEDYRRNLWIVLGMALVLCSLGSYFLIQKALGPIQDMAATAAKVRSSTLNERITIAGLPAELNTLADTFNEMLDRLQMSFERLSQFSADIAHELRTPLNNLRGEAEVALGRSRSAEEYREVIGSALEEYGKLARMIDNLLFLGRAENPATQIAREELDVGAELERLREYYEAAAAEANVRLSVACPTKVIAHLDRNLLHRALGNLVENALAHTPPDGAVTMSAARHEGWLTIEVSDTGMGIEAKHLPHLFDRFYKPDQVRSSSRRANVGLGLALVKSIAALHGGIVAVTSQLGGGTKVVLRLPFR